MPSIIEDTISVLESMQLDAIRVTTPPGYAGIQVFLPNDNQAFFVWSEMTEGDYYFRIARFWENENPFAMWTSGNLIDALQKTLSLTSQ